MQEAHDIMTQSGWTDPVNDKFEIQPVQKLNDITGAEWKQLLGSKRQEILEGRESEASQKKKLVNGINNEVNEVKLIDKKYFLLKDFKADDPLAQQLIDDTSTKFMLNEAQERAFRVVANYAVQPSGKIIWVVWLALANHK